MSGTYNIDFTGGADKDNTSATPSSVSVGRALKQGLKKKASSKAANHKRIADALNKQINKK
jgi:hypothetical protein